MLDKEFKYYLDNQEELVKKYNSKFILIKDFSVKNSFNNIQEAYDWGKEHYELGTFLY